MTHRMRLRRRLLDTYVRVELAERGAVSDERADRPLQELPLPRLEPTEQGTSDGEDTQASASRQG